MFQSNTMKISTPPLPPPQSMLCFQYTHHGTQKPNAQYDPTLNRGRGDLRLGIRCIFEASVPTLLKVIVAHLDTYYM